MHLHFERIQRPSSYSDSNLSSLTWMGKVPDGLLQSEDEGWKLNRTNYYQDGWLATGNIRGIVGVTFTTCRSRKNIVNDLPQRTNYNLRGHRSDVTLVKWNEPYQKLASCDSSGIIFVWIKYEGRWSIELINDRNTQVTDFSWSHDGRMALICYMDGFVLVGSVSGQRYWSSMLNLDSCTISCGIWSPDDQNVIFGTSSGHILVIDVHGTMVAQVSIQEGIAITSMSWSCEKFKMEDSDEERDKNGNESKIFALAVSFIDGTIYIMRNYDDLFPIIIRTGMLSTKIEWANNGEVLAIVGHKILNPTQDTTADRIFKYQNIVQFYTINGTLRLRTTLDFTQYPVTSITWGHSDKRLFIGCGPVLYIAWITKRIPSLQLLSRLAVYTCLKNEKLTEQLPLPTRLQNTVSNLFTQTLQCFLPDLTHLREFVSSPPDNNIRLHCTMIRHDEDLMTSTNSYVLYVEYLGGLVPILKGKRASKLKPEFIIFDPQLDDSEHNNNNNSHKNSNRYPLQNGMISPSHNSNSNSTPYGTSSDSEMDEPFNGRSPQTRRTRRFRSRRFRARSNESSEASITSNNSSNSTKRDVYIDDMPEHEKLVLVTSNIWGTKFKILGLSSWLPSQLGSINYRTSLLHLQPRQMTLSIKELGDNKNSSFPEVKKFENNNNNFMSSDSEDEMAMSSMLDEGISAPIAPMTPIKNIRYSNQTFIGQTRIVSPEKRSTVQFHRSGQSSSSVNPNLDFNNFVPTLTEELLTLQINGDSHSVSMEMTGPPITTMSTSISTQTSFQSITELLNSLSHEKNTQTMFSPLIENKTLEEQTEETFSLIAKRFASELPSSYYSVNRCESLHSPAIININNTSSNDIRHYPHLTSSQSISPNVSPPKGMRYKIIKKESPRKSSVSCIESDLTASRSCDTTSLFPCSPKSQRRCPATIVSSTPSASSTWGAVSVLHCSNSFADTLAIDSKSNISNDFKFIDDFEGEESADLQQYSRSPSVMFQKNRSICHMQPTIGSEFTNVRTGTDNQIGYSFQRRLTLRASKQSHSLEMSETPNHSLEKTRNCMSFEEEEEDRSISDSSECVKQSLTIINATNNSDSIEKPPKDKQILSNLGINSCSTTCVMPSSESLVNRIRKKTTFNFVDKGMTNDVLTSSSRSIQLKSSEKSILRDENTDTPDSTLSSRLHSHRGSLPSPQAIASTSTNSMNTISATTIHNRSLPASPLLANIRRRKAQGKGLLYSPMMLRKVMKQKLNYLDCSSEDDNTSDDEECDTSSDFKNLESFQKQHFRKKFKVKRRGSRVKPEIETNTKKQTVCYREFVLHNKAPLWNEVSQVYQLDFGGRVTQESAKNFQIEYQGKQVMQFGRIDGNAYTLDFQYPFSALQALSVALANVTQRLK